MEPLVSWAVANVVAFALVFARLGSLMMTAPVIGSRSVPAPVKVGAVLVMALLLAPLHAATTLPTTVLALLAALVREALIGLLIGLGGSFLLAGVQVAAQLMAMSMGLQLPSALDPVTSEHSQSLDQFYVLLAGAIFVSLDGHHWLLLAAERSLELVPLGTFALSSVSVAALVALSAEVLVIGLKLALPAVATLLLADVALGSLARTMPQMNMFALGGPLKIGLGFAALALGMPVTVDALHNLLTTLPDELRQLIG